MDTETADLAEPSTDVTAKASVGLASVSKLGAGSKLGPYEIISLIASGGMGRVWLCARRGDFGFTRTFALKTMREDLVSVPEFRRMFLAEAKLAAQVRHTNVVEMVDLGESDGVVYQVMTWVEGASLSGLLERCRESKRPPPSVPVAIRIVADLLRGLHAAHELRDETGKNLGLVHRDVSPQNILVGLDGVAKITDFGIAKASSASSGLSAVRGKPRFMAPEVLERGVVDRRADVFAAGVILWELLKGERSNGFAAELVTGGAVTPVDLTNHVNAALAAIVTRALLHSPAERWASAKDMADALDAFAASDGLVLSSGSVAAWIASVAGAELAQERETREREIERTRSLHAEAAKNKRRFVPAGIAIALALAAVAFVRWEKPKAIVAENNATASQTDPAKAATAPVAVASPTTDESASPATTTSATAAADVIAKPAHTTKPTAHPKPRPKYGNPYGTP